MITTELARELRDRGLAWHPASGDEFVIDSGTILGFNGTTEWALDSVAVENALWLPREDQLRSLLGGTFASLARTDAGDFVVETVRDGVRSRFDATDAETAYAHAVLALIGQATADATT